MSSRKGRSSLSNRVKVTTGKPRAPGATKSIPLNKTAAQRATAQKAQNDQIASLSFVQREQLLADSDIEMPNVYDVSYDLGGDEDNDSDWDDVPDDSAGFYTLPPGEEGSLESHAGGEGLFHRMLERVKPGRGDPRKRSMCVQRQIDSWTVQLPLLVDTYLQFKDIGSAEVDGVWPLNVVGFSENGSRLFAHSPDAQKANETLLRHGYIGGSPDQPAIAFSLRMFEIYRQVHRVCPRYTIDSLAKTLTYLHKIPHRSYLAEQLTTAYDAYLTILCAVNDRVQAALGRDKEWIWTGICPPCFYKVEKEAPLKYSWLGALDGNNSLKLVDSTFRAGHPRFDNRKSLSFRWLTPSQVDRYQDEVKNAPKISMATAASIAAVTAALGAQAEPSTTPASNPTPASAPRQDNQAQSGFPRAGSSTPDPDDPRLFDLPDDNDDDVAWLNINELNEEEANELERCVDTCVQRWKNAGPEARKKMFALFAVAGIFIAVCRHGHVLVICDMIRSGELMKYPLAIIDYLLDTYGERPAIGYDIMCAFFKTLLRSSMGRRVVGLRMCGIVPAFHGHAHNRACQIGWHPLYVDGAGLEDFEECERTFCLSNNLATATRMATPFHRQQQIDEHFYFHDLDKHTASDYENDHKDEAAHLEGLKHEPPAVAETIEYMELLLKYQVALDASQTAEKDYRNLDYLMQKKNYQAKEIQLVRTRYRTTFTRLSLAEAELGYFEEEHGYETRWAPTSQEYMDALVLMGQRRYRLCLNKLERLVVQRLLELTKLSMSGVGYKLREKIGKALKTRAQAIQKVLTEYNTAAAQLNPPREQLSWAQLAWTNPSRREARLLYFGIKQAKEEIRRLNVEITRLITFMFDEHFDYWRAIGSCIITAPHLARELSEQWVARTAINRSIVERLVKASQLVGFSGSLFPGLRLERDPALNSDIPLPPWASDTLGLFEVAVDDDEDAEMARELVGVDDEMMAQLMENMEIDISAAV
ncbi:hypothetical protein DFH09DRAFT_1311848 [Mycena vulgaris]|nr:hypothetical protein DFH09DRAFT_1311848 [Mycena vulgaris]